MDDAQLIDSPRERSTLTFVQFADHPPRARGRTQPCTRSAIAVWHDKRQPLFTEVANPGAGDEVIMSIAGHVSRAMLSLLPRADGSETAGPRRDRGAPAGCGREADRKSRADGAGWWSLPSSSGGEMIRCWGRPSFLRECRLYCDPRCGDPTKREDFNDQTSSAICNREDHDYGVLSFGMPAGLSGRGTLATRSM